MAKEVSVKIIRDDLAEFIMDGVDWKITELDGFNGVDATVYSDNNAIGDGSTYSGGRVGDKDRTVSARLQNKNLNEIMRRVAISFFNPKHTFKVYVTYQGRTLWCEGRQIGFKCPMDNVYRPIEITWTILSNMPYMMSVDNFGKNVAEIEGRFGFPYICKVGGSIHVSVYNFAQTVAIDNDGDVETFFQIVITATGTVENPSLYKDYPYSNSAKASEFIKILDTMGEGDVYVLDFNALPRTIKKNGQNAIGKLDRTSRFEDMKLNTGGNTIRFDATRGTNNMNVVLYYNKRYLGL